MKKQIITIMGYPGSGKSSTAKMIATRLGYEHFSSGDLFRKMAAERGLSVEEMNVTAEKQKEVDREVDDLLKTMGQEKDKMVIDSRMAFHWMPDSFKVFLDLDPETAAKRTFEHIQVEGRVSQQGSSVEEVLKNTQERINSERNRYQSLYGVNIFDKEQFDFVIDTGALGLEEVVEEVIQKFNQWLTGDRP